VIDTHAHLTSNDFRGDLAAVLRRARDAGVRAIITVGYDLASSLASVRLSEVEEDVYAAVGIHPHDARLLDEEALRTLEDLAAHPKVVAIGEIGLDFYRNLSPRRMQERAFRRQIRLALKLGLPVIIHDRDAHRRVIEILKSEKVSHGVMHCFSGDINVARQALAMGLHISFAGPITYGGKRIIDILRRIPHERILIETDCPYLAPVPYRGKRNEPAYVRLVAERLAAILGKSLGEIDAMTETNARTLFNLSA